MDINLTGPIAATLAENLTPAWYSLLVNASAGVIGGFIAGHFTLKGVSTAQKNEDRRRRRDERKKAHDQFIAFIYKMHLHTMDKNVDMGLSWMENSYAQFAQYAAEIELISPEIAKQMWTIMAKYDTEDVNKYWSKIIQDFRIEILPQMQKELEE